MFQEPFIHRLLVSYLLCNWVLEFLLAVRPLCMLCPTCWQTLQCYRQIMSLYSNTFYLVDLGIMFREIRQHIPSMAAWMESCYGSQPILYLTDHTISSCCGVQQGDPLGPLGFYLALHTIAEKIKVEVSGLLVNAW